MPAPKEQTGNNVAFFGNFLKFNAFFLVAPLVSQTKSESAKSL